jgi:hypothetical protein
MTIRCDPVKHPGRVLTLSQKSTLFSGSARIVRIRFAQATPTKGFIQQIFGRMEQRLIAMDQVYAGFERQC